MDRQPSHAEDVVGNAFGMSTYSLWANLCGHHPELSLLGQKTAFFELLKTLLTEDRVRFVKPDADVYISPNHVPAKTVNDLDAHWMAAPDEIIAYLLEGWPDTVTCWDDADLIAYLYEIPAIIWRTEGDGWCSS